MDTVLNSPEVQGALISVLGEGYIEHPHRFCHYTGPLADNSKHERTLADALRALGKQEDATSKGWNEGAVAMDDAAFALTAAGVQAVPALLALLQDSSEWVRINAAFALGELVAWAVDAVPALLRCLNDSSHRVVWTAADTLGSIREQGAVFMPELGRFLSVERPDWSEVLRRGWTANDRVRTNSAMAFCRLGTAAGTFEDVLIEALDDPCGHVAAFALLALERIGSPEAMAAVLTYLKSHRWDQSSTQANLF